jgi:hypothetical protein
MNSSDRLFTRVTSRLAALVGDRLLGMTYWCLSGEATPDSIRSPGCYLGGEVELRFSSAGSIFITWDENAGWEDHFSVQVSGGTTFQPGCLTPFDASATPQWQSHVGSMLVSCCVLGSEETPHIISFHFERGEVLVGDGYGPSGSGDGDDVLVRTTTGMVDLAHRGTAKTLWILTPSRTTPGSPPPLKG